MVVSTRDICEYLPFFVALQFGGCIWYLVGEFLATVKHLNIHESDRPNNEFFWPQNVLKTCLRNYKLYFIYNRTLKIHLQQSGVSPTVCCILLILNPTWSLYSVALWEEQEPEKFPHSCSFRLSEPEKVSFRINRWNPGQTTLDFMI